ATEPASASVVISHLRASTCRMLRDRAGRQAVPYRARQAGPACESPICGEPLRFPARPSALPCRQFIAGWGYVQVNILLALASSPESFRDWVSCQTKEVSRMMRALPM